MGRKSVDRNIVTRGYVFCSLCQVRLTEWEGKEKFLFGRNFCAGCRETGVHDSMAMYTEAKARWVRDKVFPEVWRVRCQIVETIRALAGRGTCYSIAKDIRRKPGGPEVAERQIEVIAEACGIQVRGGA